MAVLSRTCPYISSSSCTGGRCNSPASSCLHRLHRLHRIACLPGPEPMGGQKKKRKSWKQPIVTGSGHGLLPRRLQLNKAAMHCRMASTFLLAFNCNHGRGASTLHCLLCEDRASVTARQDYHSYNHLCIPLSDASTSFPRPFRVAHVSFGRMAPLRHHLTLELRRAG